MRKYYILIIFLFLLLLLNLFVFVFGFENKTNYEGKYTHTRALCQGNTCRDYKITCNGSEVLDVAPVTGFITFDEDWKDTREEKELCLS